MFGGANAAALQGPDGAREVIQFAEAELVGAGTYELSKLLRGQAGSEGAMNALLPAGAPFVLLDAHLIPVASGLDALDRALQLRVVAAGRDHGDASAVSLAVTPRATALKPLSPVHVSARRTAEGIALAWIRRTRIDGDGWTGEVPLGEESERYAVDIVAGDDVVRTFETESPSALYAAADEIADFGTPQTSVTVRVAQISPTVGRGFVAEVTLSI